MITIAILMKKVAEKGLVQYRKLVKSWLKLGLTTWKVLNVENFNSLGLGCPSDSKTGLCNSYSVHFFSWDRLKNEWRKE